MDNLLQDLAIEAGITEDPYSPSAIDKRLPADWSVTLRLTRKQIIENRIYDPKEMLNDLKDLRKEIDNLAKKYGPIIQKYKNWSSKVIDEIEPLTVTEEDTEANIDIIKSKLSKSMNPPVKPLSDVLKSYSYKTKLFQFTTKFKEATREDLGEYISDVRPLSIPNEIEFTISKAEFMEIVEYNSHLIDHLLELEDEGTLGGMHYTGWDDPPLRILSGWDSDIKYPNIDAHFLESHNSTALFTSELLDMVGVDNLIRMVAPVQSISKPKSNSETTKSWMSRLFG